MYLSFRGGGVVFKILLFKEIIFHGCASEKLTIKFFIMLNGLYTTLKAINCSNIYQDITSNH